MFRFYPNMYLKDVASIDFDDLYRRGYRGLIFDIDNTLVAHGADSNPEVNALFRRLHALGFRTLLLSNNSEERIRRFNAGIGTSFIADAGKPHPEAFRKAIRMMRVEARQAIVIGDTTNTDIAGANRAGIQSILVKYIGYYNKEKKGLRRRLERIMLFFFPLYAPFRRLNP